MHLTILKICMSCSFLIDMLLEEGRRKFYAFEFVRKVYLGTYQSFRPSSLVNGTRLEYSFLILEHTFVCCGFLLSSSCRVSSKKEQRGGKIVLLNLLKDTSLFID